jgi:hypothetical protein
MHPGFDEPREEVLVGVFGAFASGAVMRRSKAVTAPARREPSRRSARTTWLKPGQLLEEPLMQSGDVDVPEEVLEGHSSRWQRLSDRWLVSLLLALAVVSAVAIAMAVHYRRDAANTRRATAAAVSAARFRPTGEFRRSVTVANSSLPLGSGRHGLLAIVHTSTGTQRPLIISVQLLHLHPGRGYSLIGNNCQGNAPDFVWATGRASTTGSLLLVTFPRDINPNDRYWLALRQPGGGVTTGVAGTFATGDVAPFAAGHDPCSS